MPGATRGSDDGGLIVIFSWQLSWRLLLCMICAAARHVTSVGVLRSFRLWHILMRLLSVAQVQAENLTAFLGGDMHHNRTCALIARRQRRIARRLGLRVLVASRASSD